MKINIFNLHKILLNIIFGIIVLFQLTTLKISLELNFLSRVVNSLFIIFLFLFLFYAIYQTKLNKYLLYFYIFPGVLILIGFLINIVKSSLVSLDSLGYLSQTIPWIVFLIIPYFYQKNVFKVIDYWEIFSKFIFYTTIFSLIEYLLALNSYISLKAVETANGDFLTGKIAIFHKLSDGTPHFRFYSCFMEPGTFAMFLLPVICHAFYKKKYLRLFIFLTAFYFTFSLGGIFSLIIMAILILFKLKGVKKYLIVVALLFGAIFYLSFINESIKGAYDDKGNSAVEREESYSKTADNITKLFFNYPFGIPLNIDTSANQKNEFYLGTNFIPGIYLQFGGYIAFIGYIFVLMFSTILSLFLYLFKKHIYNEDFIVIISLLTLFPFIFQRLTIMESSIFAFLFSPYIIKYLIYSIDKK
ncbi:hypothetical protein [Flavobacterium sp.]|uniref:hypothetical protein n=1 Tax=Flavobacterium sp. TaxID=239 RepID=UPI0025C103CA|nr:hypothetical protein [Flavobacterium sp.]